MLNSDRSLEFQNTLAKQLTDLDFADISRHRSAKQKGSSSTKKYAVTNDRRRKRKTDEIESIDAILDEITSKSKKQK